jgi:hypothetical protein
MKYALNWEASGRNAGTWTNYFYIIRWNGNAPGYTPQTAGQLLSDVEDDV